LNRLLLYGRAGNCDCAASQASRKNDVVSMNMCCMQDIDVNVTACSEKSAGILFGSMGLNILVTVDFDLSSDT